MPATPTACCSRHPREPTTPASTFSKTLFADTGNSHSRNACISRRKNSRMRANTLAVADEYPCAFRLHSAKASAMASSIAASVGVLPSYSSGYRSFTRYFVSHPFDTASRRRAFHSLSENSPAFRSAWMTSCLSVAAGLPVEATVIICCLIPGVNLPDMRRPCASLARLGVSSATPGARRAMRVSSSSTRGWNVAGSCPSSRWGGAAIGGSVRPSSTTPSRLDRSPAVPVFVVSVSVPSPPGSCAPPSCVSFARCIRARGSGAFSPSNMSAVRGSRL